MSLDAKFFRVHSDALSERAEVIAAVAARVGAHALAKAKTFDWNIASRPNNRIDFGPWHMASIEGLIGTAAIEE